MCYVNINANIRLFKDEKNIDLFEVENQEKPELKNIVIKVDGCFMGSNNPNHFSKNIVNQNGQLKCILRMKKKIGNFNKIITSFNIDSADYDVQSDEFLWFNTSNSFIIESFPLPDVYKGEYYIDLIAKRIVNRENEDDEENDQSYQIQTRTILDIK